MIWKVKLCFVEFLLVLMVENSCYSPHLNKFLGVQPIVSETADSLLEMLHELFKEIVATGVGRENLMEDIANIVSKIQNLKSDQAIVNFKLHRIFEEYKEILIPYCTRDDISQSEQKYMGRVFPFFCLMHLQANMGKNSFHFCFHAMQHYYVNNSQNYVKL